MHRKDKEGRGGRCNAAELHSAFQSVEGRSGSRRLANKAFLDEDHRSRICAAPGLSAGADNAMGRR